MNTHDSLACAEVPRQGQAEPILTAKSRSDVAKYSLHKEWESMETTLHALGVDHGEERYQWQQYRPQQNWTFTTKRDDVVRAAFVVFAGVGHQQPS